MLSELQHVGPLPLFTTVIITINTIMVMNTTIMVMITTIMVLNTTIMVMITSIMVKITTIMVMITPPPTFINHDTGVRRSNVSKERSYHQILLKVTKYSI